MSEFVRAMVYAPSYVALTTATPEWWAEQVVGQAVLIAGRQCGIVREANVKDGGVEALIELDDSVYEQAFEWYVGGAIA